MAPLLTTTAIVFALSNTVAAFAPNAHQAARVSHNRPTVALKESFGFDFAEDQVENTPAVILGEANYKQWVGEEIDNSFLNRQYDVVRRVRELDLLALTAELGILSKLEKQGVDLATIESLLPQAESLGLLSLVGNNQQLLINFAAPLLIEPAPILLPIVAGALDIGAPAFFLAAAALAGTDIFLIANDVEVPFIGLPAGVLLGLLLLPLSVVLGGVGVFFSSVKK